ncbi:MAG: hypothetical protein KAY37_14605 [Phycisphaerae bacterium]|nr:hypothetical protein [Phycisphaerae bacterium]
MTRKPGPSYGRAAMFGVLIALLLTICAGAYLIVARRGVENLPVGIDDPEAENYRVARLTVLLTILLISALLILLFVLGCYLLIRVGRIVRRPIAGQPTPYVDAWKGYRLTEEEIAAATTEHPPDDEPGGGAAEPDSPPSDPDPQPPSS